VLDTEWHISCVQSQFMFELYRTQNTDGV